MRRRLGTRNIAPDSRALHVMLRQNSVRTTSALDYWDQLVTLHYGGRVGITAHFRETTIAETGMFWAGAPFVTPAAGSITLENSILNVSTTGRAFLYQQLPATNTYDKRASVALRSYTVGDMIGLRLDDGGDNNYLEVVLRVSQASPTLWNVRTRRRAGGGAVTTQDGDDMHTDPGFVLSMNLTGTPWEAWNAYPVLATNMGFFGRMAKPRALLAASTFTPTRAGIVWIAGGEEDMAARVDWFDKGRA